FIIDSLSAGVYTVLVTDTDDPYNTCFTTTEIIVPADSVDLSITADDYVIAHNENCSAAMPNGAIRIDGIREDGTFVDFATLNPLNHDFTITWSGPGGPVAGLTATIPGDSISGLVEGTYTATIINNITACEFISQNFIIEADSIVPLLSLESTAGSNYCDVIDDARGANFIIGDGALNIDLTHASDVIDNPDGSIIANTDYLIEWYIDLADPTTNPGNGDALFLFDNLGNTNANLEFVGTVRPVNVGGNDDFTNIDSLRAGTYTVFVTKLATATNPNDIYLGCGSSASYVIEDISLNPEQIVVSQPVADNSFTPVNIGTGKGNNYNCDQIYYNGYIEISEVIEVSTIITDLSNYEFIWYTDAAGTNLLNEDPNPLLADGVISDAGSGIGNRIDSLEGGTYYVTVQNLTTGCPNPAGLKLIPITIEDDARDPQIDFVDKTVTTLCETGINEGNATLTVEFFEEGNPTVAITQSEYRIEWYRDSTNHDPSHPTFLFDNQGNSGLIDTVATASPITPGDYTALNGLGADEYTVYIEKLVPPTAGSPGIGCATKRTYEIVEDLTYPNFNIPETQVVHNTICDPTDGDPLYDGTGEITIVPSNFNIPSNPPVSDLTSFNWTVNYTAEGEPSVPFTDFTVSSNELSMTGLEPGVYGFTADDAITGCGNLAEIEVEVLNQTISPALGEVVLDPDLSCISNKDNFVDGGSGRIILVNVDPDGTGENLIELPNSRYIISWFIGFDNNKQDASANANIEIANTTDTLFNLSEGIYEVEIYDTQTNCTSTQQIEVFREEVAPFVTNFEVNNNTFCAPKQNGSIVIVEISYNGDILDLNPIFTEDPLGNVTDTSYFENLDQQYQISWFDSDGTTALTDPEPSTPFELEGLSADDAVDGKKYFASVQQVDNQCASDLIEFTLFDNPFIPEIVITTLQADSTCVPNGFPNGEVFAVSSGQNGDDSTLVFNWYSQNDLNTIIAVNDTLSNVPAGTYVVEVLDSFTGCEATAEVTIENVPPVTEIIDFIATDPTQCDPPNGTVEIVSVTTNALERMVFDIYDENPGRPITANPAPILTSDTSVMVFGERSAEYFIVGRDTLTGCTTAPIQVLFGDETPAVTLEQLGFTFQTNCDPARANGTITIAANGSQDTTLFRFEWFDENGILTEVNSATADSLSAGLYTAVVTDLSSGCTFEIELPMADDLENPFPFTTSTTSNFNCINPNGRMSVTVTNARKPLFVYRYLWKIGADQTPTESDFDFEGQLVEGVPAGVYSAIVIDTDDRFCTSLPINVTVEDATTPPEFFLSQIEPLTNCDPARPNAIAEAGVPGDDLFRYSFEWFIGTDTAGVEPIATGITIDSLAAITYGVVATDALTGCRSLETITIEDATVPPPTPDVTIGNDRTNCLMPNGTAFASVGGDILAYDFTWYSFSNPDSALGTGPSIATLDIGDYFVTTTEIATGCVSGATPLSIIDARVEPEFTVETRLSLCARDGNNLDEYNHNGEGRIIFTNANFVEIDSIVWYFDADEDGVFEINEGPTERQDQQLGTGAPGRHKVWIRDGNGCDYEQEFVIGTEIVVYNGVSDNGDGLNDIFLIDCLDYFPNNNVKIYNRAGVLIYEIDNYDNFTNFFNGYGNRGGANGNQQAEGTYFYIIDKGDGSDLLQGYLELTR
ncbi:MAG: gliding motility-associated C-terminal domain-containing protein, partial [Cyclobacteriaceae bacterium]